MDMLFKELKMASDDLDSLHLRAHALERLCDAIQDEEFQRFDAAIIWGLAEHFKSLSNDIDLVNKVVQKFIDSKKEVA